MFKESKSPSRLADTPRDKPTDERREHANLDRPGGQAHPQARGRNHAGAVMTWRTR